MTTTPPLPPDRAHILTETPNPRSAGLHALSAGECLRLIQREDRAVLDAIDRAMPALTALVEAIEPRFRRGGRVVYIGAGTSGRLGVLDASEMPPTYQIDPSRFVGVIAGGDSALRKSSEGAEDDPAGAHAALKALNLTADDAVVGVAAGGTTPYVLGGLALAAGSSLTALISCAPVPTPPGVHHLVVLETGPEVVTGSTRMKAGTATKLALNMLSTTLMVRTGRVYGNLMVDLRATNQKLRDRAARIISTLTGVDRAAAFALLDAAGGEVKAALVMQRRGVGPAEARALLEREGGRVDRVLEGR